MSLRANLFDLGRMLMRSAVSLSLCAKVAAEALSEGATGVEETPDSSTLTVVAVSVVGATALATALFLRSPSTSGDAKAERNTHSDGLQKAGEASVAVKAAASKKKSRPNSSERAEAKAAMEAKAAEQANADRMDVDGANEADGKEKKVVKSEEEKKEKKAKASQGKQKIPTEEEIAQLRKRVLDNKIYRNFLVSEDGLYTAVMIRSNAFAESIQEEALDAMLEGGFEE